MTGASNSFQEIELAHLNQLRTFVESYCQLIDNNLTQLGKVHQEYQIQMTDLTVENLLEQFTLAKHTGLVKPGAVEFDAEKISLASMGGPPSDISDRSISNPDANSLGGGGVATGNLLGGSSSPQVQPAAASGATSTAAPTATQP